ncbi:MAG: septum formation initiator [Epsilonproteobacteria bacterium]|nr:MAG: septum formation initiator [Campylobacterota bacterium]
MIRLSLGFLVLVYFVYLGFFSKNSWIIHHNLTSKQKILSKEIYDIRDKNAKLQKEYLELKNLEPQ